MLRPKLNSIFSLNLLVRYITHMYNSGILLHYLVLLSDTHFNILFTCNCLAKWFQPVDMYLFGVTPFLDTCAHPI
jgi:hypothetical protein